MEYRKHPITGEWIIHQQNMVSPTTEFYTSFSLDGIDMPLHKKLRSVPMQEMTAADFMNLFAQYREWVDQIHSICPDACIPGIVDPHAGREPDFAPSQMIVYPPEKNFCDLSMRHAQTFYQDNDKCLWCAMIDHELELDQRIVKASEDYIILEPYAARFPFETYIMPRDHISSYQKTPHGLVEALAKLCAQYVPRIYEESKQSDFSVFLHHVSTDDSRCDYLHWYLQLIPFMNTWAGFEIATAMHINVTTPEDCAGKISQKIDK